ncbi:Ryanodine receptor Ryr [Parasporobacterium paucivorans]|nr:Ryanodine receptor Ryr [Parasporobacterium paucivorans]
MNNLLWTSNPKNTAGHNWQGHTNVSTLGNPGESLLLARMITQSANMDVISPNLSPDYYGDRYLSSFTELELFRISDKNSGRVYRVGRFLGFKGTHTGKPELLSLENDVRDAEIVVIDDENNGFNNAQDFWPLAIKTTESKPVVLYKMNNPIGTNLLWQHLDRFHIERTVVIINADDLRAKGVNISKSISWEKTALDFVWQLNNNPNLSFLADCRHLVVPFGLEGVIYYKNEGEAEAFLYFLPYEFEGDFIREDLGYMYGLTSCFVAALTGTVSEGYDKGDLPELISKGIRVGMAAARKYFNAGFGNDLNNLIFPNPSIFRENPDDSDLMEDVQSVRIPVIGDSKAQNRWYILKEKNTANLADIAFDLVKNGEEKALKYIPTARFGNLKAVDRTEIESYRSIKNLLSEYINAVNVTRPLSIAVFGTPGSGKSFGVTEIAASIAPSQIQRLVYNLSQFHSPEELIRAFHKISDYSLLGKIPFIIFDEFDSDFEGNLGWLKYFLAPMQDGVYREEQTIHPIGKAIFVFAGGTSSTFREFCGDDLEDEMEISHFAKKFKAAKGPDFVSRLRGYVNILGPNRTSVDDQLYIIRRAMLLRALVDRKLPQMINEKGEAQIDNGVIRAMLKIPRFKHETRSMEAIIEMSMVNRAKRWDQSLLPPKEQLSLHVDEEQFLRYMMHDAIFGEKVDELASALRFKYNQQEENWPVPGDDILTDWKNLGEEHKEFFRSQVKCIPDALLHIQCDVIYVDCIPENMEFSENEIEQLTLFEYKRRMIRSRENGTGPVLDKNMEMVVWEHTDQDLKQQINQMVRLWADVLAMSHFKVERLKIED